MRTTCSTPTVLLVEDSDDDAYFFSRALQKCGFAAELVRAADGAQAIRQLEAAAATGLPDIVFLDLKLPVFSGFEILRWLQQRSLIPPLHVVVLSGSDEAADIQEARALGVADYLVKPVTAAQLATCLARARDAAAAPPPPAEKAAG